MASIKKLEPNYEIMARLYFEQKERRTKAQIWCVYQDEIAPEVPVITEQQFIDWTLNSGEAAHTEFLVATNRAKVLNAIDEGRVQTIGILEGKMRRIAGKLLDEAEKIMDENAIEAISLKERYFAAAVVKDVWGKVIKEKEVALKAHAEKRETVGMFGKLMDKAQAGEITMDEVINITQEHETIIDAAGIAQ